MSLEEDKFVVQSGIIVLKVFDLLSERNSSTGLLMEKQETMLSFLHSDGRFYEGISAEILALGLEAPDLESFEEQTFVFVGNRGHGVDAYLLFDGMHQ